MDLTEYALLYGITLILFAIIDAVWIGVVSKDLYAHFLKNKMLNPPLWVAAAGFYVIFIAGLVYFAIAPSINDQNIALGALNGALYGFFTFSTYQLTNVSTLKGWPKRLVGIDIAWGTIACFTASIMSYVVYKAIL